MPFGVISLCRHAIQYFYCCGFELTEAPFNWRFSVSLSTPLLHNKHSLGEICTHSFDSQTPIFILSRMLANPVCVLRSSAPSSL